LVSGPKQSIPNAVEQHECELAIQSAQKGVAQFFIEMNQDLDVSLRPEAVPFGDKLLAQITVIKYLAITDQENASILIRKRLIARKQINYAQPSEAEPDPLVDHVAAVIWATMRQRLRHCLNNIR
jgi:hypothetical protein